MRKYIIGMVLGLLLMVIYPVIYQRLHLHQYDPWIVGVVSIGMGLILLRWRDQIVEQVAEGQLVFWGYRHTPQTLRVGRIMTAVVGVCALALGALIISGLLPTRRS